MPITLMDPQRPSLAVSPAPKASLRSRFLAYLGRAVVSLQHRDFRYLAFSSLAMGLGMWFAMIGTGWLVYEVTGSALQLASVTSLSGLASLVATPLGGVLADRFDRRAIAAWASALAAVQALALTLVVVMDWADVWHLYLFAGIGGVATGLGMPARQALVFNVVPRESLPNAIAMNSISQNLARVAGPALAGIAIGFAGTASAFLILALATLAAVALTLPIRGTATQARTVGESPFVSLARALSYARGHPTILGLLFLGVVPPVLVWPYMQLLPLFADKILHSGASGYGILATAVGWGSLVGLVWLLLAKELRRKGFVVMSTQVLYIVLVGAFSQSRFFPLSWLLLALAGLFLIISMTLTNTLFQEIVPDEFRGRVMSLYTMSFGLQPLGALPMGAAAAAWGAPNAVLAFMALATIGTLAVWAASPALRRI